MYIKEYVRNFTRSAVGKVMTMQNLNQNADTYLANCEYFCTPFGPVLNAASAVSSNPSDGFLSFTDSTCEHFT